MEHSCQHGTTCVGHWPAPTPEMVERVARAIYETGERLRADDDIPGSPWTPWQRQTSYRERHIVYEQARAALAAMKKEE